MKKRAARRKVVSRASKGNFFDQLLHKKHRPLHGLALGSILVLLKSVWGILALVGMVLMVVSAVALLMGKMSKKA